MRTQPQERSRVIGFVSELLGKGKSENRRVFTGDEWWAWVDLNHRPRPYQGLLWCYMHSIMLMDDGRPLPIVRWGGCCAARGEGNELGFAECFKSNSPESWNWRDQIVRRRRRCGFSLL